MLKSVSTRKTPGVVNRPSERSKIADRTLGRLKSDISESYGTDVGGDGIRGGSTNRNGETRTSTGSPIKFVGDYDEGDGEDGHVRQVSQRPPSSNSLAEAESEARRRVLTNPLALFFVNGVASFYVFVVYLISLESAFGVLLSISATVWVYITRSNIEGWDGTMDWVLLSFAVVTPMSVSIGISFKRREQALRDIAIFRSNAYQLYLAHACWDWGTTGPGGRAISAEKAAEEERLSSQTISVVLAGDEVASNASSGAGAGAGAAPTTVDPNDFWREHADRALSQLIGIADELARYLTLPSFSRARHRVTYIGRKEAARTVEVSYRLFDSLLTTRMAQFTKLTEEMKRRGLPPNEASRIRQWERLMGEAIEDLRMLKSYRTPQALRSFARLFTVFLPPFYAPTLAQLSRDMNSIGIGIAFAAITSLALTALFESIYILEDPFVAHLTLDGIDVHEELQVLHWHQLLNARRIFFPAAPKFDDELSSKGRGKHAANRQQQQQQSDDVHPSPMMQQGADENQLNISVSESVGIGTSLPRESSYVQFGRFEDEADVHRKAG